MDLVINYSAVEANVQVATSPIHLTNHCDNVGGITYIISITSSQEDFAAEALLLQDVDDVLILLQGPSGIGHKQDPQFFIHFKINNGYRLLGRNLWMNWFNLELEGMLNLNWSDIRTFICEL